MRSSPTSRPGASASPAGAPRCRGRLRRSPRSSRRRIARSTARRCSSRSPRARRSSTLPARWSRPAPRCAPRPSSEATRPAIRSRPTAPGRFLPGADALHWSEVMSALLRPEPRPGVLAIDAYVPGKSAAPGVAKVFKLSSNETPLGPSPKAVEAYLATAAHLHDYPDGAATELREAIGRAFGLDPARIVCGAGSDELLNLLAHAFIGPGDEAIHTTHGFLVYHIATLGAGGTPVIAPETNYTADVDAILARVSPRTKLIYLANPNKPTGTYVPFDEVKRLHRALPPHVLLVLDAAYAEYVRRNDYESGIELVATTDNTVMCRTFSKIHGLAGLRLGWMYGPAHVVDAINRIRGPFNVNSAVQAAGIAAIQDTAHVEMARAHNEKWLDWLQVEIRKLGLDVTASVANFVLIQFPSAKAAEDADAFLTERGLILRRVKAYKLPNALRMTVGTEEANRLVVEAMAELLGRK